MSKHEKRPLKAVPSVIEPVAATPTPPDPEVSERPKRRTFTAEFKLRVLEEVDRALATGESGQVGEILRREGLYSSHLSEWRRERRDGALASLGKKRGRKAKRARDAEAEQLRREVARLRRELEQAHLVIDVQKKLSQILGIPLPDPPDGEKK
jgi:transposase-like protein